MTRTIAYDLPPGLVLDSVLADSPKGQVLKVNQGGRSLVLRLFSDAGPQVSAQAAVASGLTDPGLIPPVAWGLSPGGRPYLLRPWLDGQTFDQAVKRADPRQVARWMRTLLGSLSTLHRAGLVHRDVKAENVLVAADRVYLIDLDLVAERGAATAGSRFHLAPEVLLGQPHEPAADLFALGVMLAVSLLGPPDKGFHRQFPTRSFWAASGLEPGRLDPALAPLVRACVRRHPLDRPASAASAARLVGDAGGDPAAEAAPDPRLPFVAGRQAALQLVLDRLVAAPEERLVVLLSVEDSEEEPALLDHLQLALAMQGRRVLRSSQPWPGAAAGPAQGPAMSPDAALRQAADGERPDLALAASADLPPGADVADLVLSFLLPTRPRAPRLLVALPPGATRDLDAMLRRRHLDDEVSNLAHLAWPRVTVAALEEHLQRLGDGASPEVTVALAQALHRRTAGRLADIQRLLLSADRLGVLRADGSRLVPLRNDWPEGGQAEPLRQAELGALPAPARSVLVALACLDAVVPAGCPPMDVVAALAEQTPEACGTALLLLQARGIVARDGRFTDRRWAGAAHASLDRPALAGWHRRCAEALAGDGNAAGVRAQHQLLGAQTADDFAQVLEATESELARGHLAEARALLQGLVERVPAELEIVRRRLPTLGARLDLAQGRAEDAVAGLRRAYGEGLATAPADALLAAAAGHELSGRRAEARVLFRRVLALPIERADRLRALTGLAYGLFLDGAWEAALEVVAGEPRDDDPDEPAAGLLNLRGVALTRLARHDEARAALAEALALATRSGDPLARARTELNGAHLERRCARPAVAAAGLQRAIAAFTEAGHVQGRALALNNLGVLQRDLGDLRRAAALLHESLELRRRVGDAHGAASSLGSLALVELDAGQVGAALATLRRGRDLMLRGGYEAELVLVDLASAIALALAGRHLEAASLVQQARSPQARTEHAALAARAEALVEFTGGQRDLALAAARSARDLAAGAGDLAEEFRATALLAALLPGDAPALAALADLASRLDSPVRRLEAELRALATPDAVDAPTLQAWLAVFEQAGRTDLVVAVAQLLARRLDESSDLPGRRRALARAAEAADALTDGLPAHEKEATLARLARLTGAAAVAAPARRGLTLDWFLSSNRRMAAEADLPGLLLAIVDMALDLTGARHGFLVLMDGERVDCQAARGMNEENLSPDEVRFSRTVVREAVTTRAPVLTTDAASDRRFQGTESITSLRLRSVVCVPLPEPLTGALYLDSEHGEQAFDETDAAAVGSLADQAGLAIASLRRRAEIETLNRRLAERVAFQHEELQRARTLLRRQGSVAPVGGLVGDSEAMQKVYALVARLAPTDLPVLVTGPSGAGKDLVARALHARSRRAEGPLVVENVSALPATLLESELFGHVRGAFTGADRDRPGLFTEADHGTFFMDEIGEMPMELQAKLLRVLESGELRPVGARKPVRVDVRIVAATNRDLLERVRSGAFREDLYYRLNAAEIHLPPLSERLEDIPALARHFLDRLNEKYGTAKALHERVVAALVARAWPGQVRELSNEVARLYFLSDDTIDDADLLRAAPASATGSEPMPASLRLEDVEQAAILRALRAAGQRKDRAASLLGISRAGLYAKLKRMGVEGAAPGEDPGPGED